jgi:acyl carrier protein phosphodiesterase
VNEVETILNEIRERVRREHEQNNAPDSLSVESVKLVETDPPGRDNSRNLESLNLLAAHLTTTTRAWDRLPPVNSERRGSAARFELWLKSRLKGMSRWFTWEQVNFNSAVHHALTETLNALSGYAQELARYEHELGKLRSELSKENQTRQEKLDRSDRDLAALRAVIESLANETRKRETNLAARCAALEAHYAALDARANETPAAMTREIDAARLAFTAQLTELAGELRENDSQLREEQRVCFKQLSLEASEAAVRADRTRRLVESRLQMLEKET